MTCETHGTQCKKQGKALEFRFSSTSLTKDIYTSILKIQNECSNTNNVKKLQELNLNYVA